MRTCHLQAVWTRRPVTCKKWTPSGISSAAFASRWIAAFTAITAGTTRRPPLRRRCATLLKLRLSCRRSTRQRSTARGPPRVLPQGWGARTTMRNPCRPSRKSRGVKAPTASQQQRSPFLRPWRLWCSLSPWIQVACRHPGASSSCSTRHRLVARGTCRPQTRRFLTPPTGASPPRSPTLQPWPTRGLC